MQITPNNLLKYVGGHTTFFQGLCLQVLLMDKLSEEGLKTLKGYAILMEETKCFVPMPRGLPLVLLRDYLIKEDPPYSNLIKAVVTDLGEFINELNRTTVPSASGESRPREATGKTPRVDTEKSAQSF